MNPAAAIKSSRRSVACPSPNADVLRCGSGMPATRWNGEGRMTRLPEFLRETGCLDPFPRGSP